MHFVNTASLAVLAALGTVSNAWPHGRGHQHVRSPQGYGEGGNEPSIVTVYPVPISTNSPIPNPTEPPTDDDPTQTLPGPTGSFSGTGGPIYHPPMPITSEPVTLTYTLGTGTSTSVVTTTVMSPVFPPDGPEATRDPSNESPDTESTTTISSTSTTTEYITLYPAPTDGPGGGNGGGNDGGNGGGDGGNCSPVTVTETTTERITVTASPSGSEPTENPDPSDPDTPIHYPPPVHSSGTPSDPPFPFPSLSSSGFITATHPKPTGTGAPEKPSPPGAPYAPYYGFF